MLRFFETENQKNVKSVYKVRSNRLMFDIHPVGFTHYKYQKAVGLRHSKQNILSTFIRSLIYSGCNLFPSIYSYLHCVIFNATNKQLIIVYVRIQCHSVQNVTFTQCRRNPTINSPNSCLLRLEFVSVQELLTDA